MYIKVLNKNNFNRLMSDNNISCDNIDSFKNLYLISINDTSGEMSKSYFENCKSNNLLVLHFDDSTDSNQMDLSEMTEEQGRLIFNFIKNIKLSESTQLIIHCTAGQNRSGSVGKFARDYFKYDVDKFNIDNPIVKGNSTVTRILNRLWMWSHY